jgi:hypothetical protein
VITCSSRQWLRVSHGSDHVFTRTEIKYWSGRDHALIRTGTTYWSGQRSCIDQDRNHVLIRTYIMDSSGQVSRIRKKITWLSQKGCTFYGLLTVFRLISRSHPRRILLTC